MTRKALVLGRDRATHQEVYLSEEARKLSLYILGRAGYGKTTLLKQLVLQDMQSGEGLCFIDPHGDAAEELLQSVPTHREQDVIFWDPSDLERPFGLNPFARDTTDPIVMSSRVQSFVAALESLEEFRDVFALGTRMKDLLLRLGWAFVANPEYSLIDAIDFLGSKKEGKAYRLRFYDKLSRINPRILKDWQSFDQLTDYQQLERVESSLNKLRRFSTDPLMQGIFGQTVNTLDFRKLMDEGKILILKLSGIGQYNAAFIGAFVVWELWQAALSRHTIPEAERRPFHLYADEFYTYMTSAFPAIQMQGRKFGLDTVIAHQTRDQIEDIQTKGSTLAVVNKVVFQVSGKDAQELSHEFKAEASEEETIEKPKRAIPMNVLEHLAKHSHTDPQVNLQYHHLRDLVDSFFTYHRNEAVKETSQQLLPRLKVLRPLNPPSSSEAVQMIDSRKKELEDIIDRWLYRSMAEPNFNPMRLMFADEANSETYDIIWTVSMVLWKIQDPSLSRYSYEELKGVNEPHDKAMHEVDDAIHRAIIALGLCLKVDPCHVQTGQHETMTKRIRTVADVQAQNADTLSHLPRYVARCRVLEGNTTAEYTIQIRNPGDSGTDEASDVAAPDGGGGAGSRAARIKERSRKLGSSRKAVEEGIRKRMASVIIEKPASSQTPPSTTSRPKPKPGEYNDEGPI
jgi:hypothetical protein